MPRSLTRDTQHAVLGGVAAGFGRYLDVDPVLVRLGFVLLALFHGLGLLLYVASWVLMPRAARPAVAGASSLTDAGLEGAPTVGEPPTPDARRDAGDPGSAQLAVGSGLVVLGALLLAHNLGWLEWPHWMRLRTLWPLVLMALGAGLIRKSRRVRTA